MKRGQGVFGPELVKTSAKRTVFIDDLNLPGPIRDDGNPSSAHELLRHWFDYGGWHTQEKTGGSAEVRGLKSEY